MTKENEVLFEKTIEVRWSDCDANRHMRHSAYADFCAHTRVAFLSDLGMTPEWFEQQKLGPILFQEEPQYRREVHMGESLRVTVEAGEATGFTKSIQILQHLYKPSGELAAVLRCVVAWMDLEQRKVIGLPESILQRFPVQLED